MVGVPNEGQATAFTVLQYNWTTTSVTFDAAKPVVQLAYRKNSQGTQVESFDGVLNIDFAAPDAEQQFISQYVPVLHQLLPTHDFIQVDATGREPLSSTSFRNDLLDDLSAGPFPDPSLHPTLNVIEMRGVLDPNEWTATYVQQEQGGARPSLLEPQVPLEQGQNQILGLTDSVGRDPLDTENWYREVWWINAGDGTVSFESALPTTQKNTKIYNTSPANHESRLVKSEVLQDLLNSLPVTPGSIAAGAPVNNQTYYIQDPINGFLVDAQMRRLGFSQATGPITEIPGSVYLGVRWGSLDLNLVRR